MSENELKKHALAFGSLMGNMLSLEFLVRLFLLDSSSESKALFPESDRLHQLKRGDILSLNGFTQDNYFSKVVQKYNCHSKILKIGLTINETIVDIRNALAHGVILGENTSFPLRLLHFENQKGKVIVKLNALLTIEWFNTYIIQVRRAMDNVEKAIELLREGKL